MISRVCKGDGRAVTAGIDNAVLDQWCRIRAIRSVPVIDGLLAATALTHDLTLVTRNNRDFAGWG
ncbi:PIN domain-containing protein [Bradyrhizobium diversitatis]|uniref:PIN domain-containing protein n=1 Tax=Bradyrhizobium diversitatis TaxID=2755406 RepID=A0ABS0PDP1_9BRAD|nr:PIN domain-containing protein [Bradyrhizobium diversitatis]